MSGAEALLGIVARLARARVACVGDVMLDRFIGGVIERISPEAPVPVLRIAETTTMLGGAGNVARNLAALGVASRLIAVVGDDDDGRAIATHVAAEPVLRARILTDGTRATTVKTRYLAGTQQLLRADRETIAPLCAPLRRDLLAAVDAALPQADVLVLSDYGKGVLAEGVAGALIARARAGAVPVIVDPKGRDFRVYTGASLITPNRRELAEALGTPVAAGTEAEAAARLKDLAGVGAVLVTLGRDGMLLVDGDGAHLLPTVARAVFDVSGAGDTVVATLAAAHATGAALADAAALANLAAGLVVGKVGTAVVHRDELEDALRREQREWAEGKILTRARAAERAGVWRRRGLRVGFTNGCFDLIHPGHVALLAFAKAACDRLIVGLNSDASVTRLKGAGRPVQSATARAVVLAALASVDAVVVFDEDTPADLIATLRPDVLVKGADYRLADVVGARFVQGYGGRVLLAPLAPGHSTTATLRTLAAGDGTAAAGGGEENDNGTAAGGGEEEG